MSNSLDPDHGPQGRIQDFLIGCSNLQRGLDLLILLDYLSINPDFSEN